MPTLALVAMLAAQLTAADPAPVRVMTYNIRFDNPGDMFDAWIFRKGAVAELIRHERPEVLGLQEALRSQIDELAARLDDYSWYGLGRDDGAAKGEHAPIFYRHERFHRLEKGTFWLSQTPDVVGSKGWDAKLPRVATWLKLQDKQSGVVWFFCNAHLDHQGEQARVESAKLLRRKLGEFAKTGRVVLLGDFNVTDDSECFRTLVAADAKGDLVPLADARAKSRTPPTGPNTTWNAFQAPAPNQRIDFIVVGPHLAVQSHRILEAKHGGRFTSDHFPVVVDVVAEGK